MPLLGIIFNAMPDKKQNEDGMKASRDFSTRCELIGGRSPRLGGYGIELFAHGYFHTEAQSVFSSG
jgi:hypothetical protein